MGERAADTGVMQVLLQHFERHQLPRILELKKKVERGQLLNDYDIDFLEQVLFVDAEQIRPYLRRHPEYAGLVTHTVHLYKEIMEKAVANEMARTHWHSQ